MLSSPAPPAAAAVAARGELAEAPRASIHPLWWALPFLPFLVLAVLPSIPGAGVNSDDFGQYLMHARALADGHPYGQILYLHSRLNAWIGPELALPGVPLLLAPALWLAGTALVPWVMLGVALLFLVLAARYFAGTEDPRLALVAVAICGLNAAMIFNATQPLTDLPLSAAVWGVILLADRGGRPSLGRMLALTAMVLVALSMRVAAVALVPALLATAFLRRRSSDWRLAVPVLCLALVGAAGMAIVDFHRLLLLRMSLGRVLSWMFSPHNMLFQAQTYVGILLRDQMGGHFAHGPALVVGYLALALTLLGVAEWMRRHPRAFATVFTLVYGAMLVVLPFHHARYLWPLAPILAFGLVNGVRVLASLLGAVPARATRAALAVGLAVALLGAVDTAREPRPVDFEAVPQGRELFAYLNQLKQREHIRVSFEKPRMLAWKLGIPAMGTFKVPEEVGLRELCAKRITHVIVAGGAPPGPPVNRRGGTSIKWLTALRPAYFRREFANERYEVYRYTRACPAPVAAAAAPGGSAPGARGS